MKKHGFRFAVEKGDATMKRKQHYASAKPKKKEDVVFSREKERMILQQQQEIFRLQEAYQQKADDLDAVMNSRSWKMTIPYRFVGRVVKETFHLIPPELKQPYYIATADRIAKAQLYSRKELRKQRKQVFPEQILFSIVVPLFNTRVKFLKEMIQSVQNQSYPRWELCLADGSDAEHSYVAAVCKRLAHSDSRIIYRKLERNGGISANTNACLEMASGDYVGLLDHDDLLHPAALYETARVVHEMNADIVYTDEAHFHFSPRDAYNPHFKPDYAPDTLSSNNYICHFTAFRRSLLEKSGNFVSECDGAQDHDLMMRLAESAERIAHIPEVLYYWRAAEGSTALNPTEKLYAVNAGIRANQRRLERLGLQGEVSPIDPGSTIYRTQYVIPDRPLVSVLISEGEDREYLLGTIRSVLTATEYTHYELLILTHKNIPVETAFPEIQDSRVRTVFIGKERNPSTVYNKGEQVCSGQYLVMMQPGIEVISPCWIEEMLMFCRRPDVGATGAKIFNPDNTIRHAGVALGLNGPVGIFFEGCSWMNAGYMGRLVYTQNVSAVTGGCMMIRRDVWQSIHGLDTGFSEQWNDIDFCLRLRRQGYNIIWTPFAEFYSFAKKNKMKKRNKSHEGEEALFLKRWEKEITAGDPYFNPNFDHSRTDFMPSDEPARHEARLTKLSGKGFS